VESIFSVVDKLYIHHKEFSGYLRERVSDWEDFASRSLGDIFIQHTGALPVDALSSTGLHQARSCAQVRLIAMGSWYTWQAFLGSILVTSTTTTTR
jgi:hypothetical protein